ncbi:MULTISPECIES: hypothetical protein [Bacillus]|uniref:hypothetical protein n=1 Tax=Bacillus TaxID=1386 RepID=UPI0015E0ADEA|nr:MULTISPECIES: hypothetical protein [Bacillus]
MDQINQFISDLAHNYILIVAAAILFFAGKAVIGYFTYKHYDRKFRDIENKLDQLMRDK